MEPVAPTTTYSYANGTRPSRMDVVAEFQQRGMYLKPFRDGRHAVQCPWNDQHSNESGLTETLIFAPPNNGAPWGFDCKHAHCTTRTIKDVLAFLRPSTPSFDGCIRSSS